jgi:hypothetical protein
MYNSDQKIETFPSKGAKFKSNKYNEIIMEFEYEGKPIKKHYTTDQYDDLWQDIQRFGITTCTNLENMTTFGLYPINQEQYEVISWSFHRAYLQN